MALSPSPRWMTELIAIVQQLCPPAVRNATDDDLPATGKDRKIGRVSRDLERGAGWFWLGLEGKSYESDQLDAAYLAPGEGADQQKYQLIETLQDGNVLRVRAAEHAPPEGLCLWIPDRAPGMLEKSLLDGLANISRFELINRFAEGSTDPVPSITGHAETGDAPDMARAACRTPGVHLVWGPPGTGKTRVIALGLQDLINSGKSVLLVSGTNIAVDNALDRAFKALNPAPGVMVRVGNPHLPEIAANPAVCLEALVRERQEVLERQLLELERQISILQEQPVIGQLADAESDLKGFSQDAFLAARERLTLTRKIADAKRDMGRLAEQRAALQTAATTRARQHDDVLAAHEEAARARSEVAAAQVVEENLAMADTALLGAEADVIRFEREHRQATRDLQTAKATRRFGHGRQKEIVKDKERELNAAIAELNNMRSTYEPLIPSARATIDMHLRNALPYTPESLARLDADLAEASDQARAAQDALDAHAQRSNELATWIGQAEQRPRATDADAEFIERAVARDLPGKLADLPRLRQLAAGNQKEITELEQRYEQVLSTMRKEKSQISRGIIREAKVVAATLAMARMNREVRERDYDFVIVDEVAFACPPEVLFAASRAREGVTLLGDFMQNAPIVPERFAPERSKDPVVQRWYQQDCFALFGIRDGQSALADPGCVTLTTQYRFGEVINALANQVAYDGMLQVGRESTGDAAAQKVVLIDVDGLGDKLAGVRRIKRGGAGWWPVGGLLARALAEQQAQRAEEAGESASLTAGILVPYKLQQELVQDFLNESGASPQIEVGTSHRFQGREFDTVVFDLIEDGAGWVANGDRYGNSYQAGGVRLFNVGITRARQRLYLIANGSAVMRSRQGPLLAVRKLLDTGLIHKVSARDILGLTDAPLGDTAASEVWHALRDHVILVGLYDEERLPDELCHRIDEAKRSIWMWSPWVGKRADQFLPHLRDAADRGVDVRPVILPPDGVNRYQEPRHLELAAQFPSAIHVDKEHQKIIVIDHRLTFIGSMNVLAHPQGGRHEVMALFQGSAFAQRILEHERADVLANPPTCGNCHARVDRVRAYGGRDSRRLFWICKKTRDGQECGWTRQFPDSQGTRNQPRPRR